MSSVIVKKNFLSAKQIEDLAKQARDYAEKFWLKNPMRTYPERLKHNLYPGCIIEDAGNILDLFMSITKEVSEQAGWFTGFDSAIGSGVNYLNPQKGEILNYHIDKPLYELDGNFQIKPEYQNRFCSKTVVVCLSNTAEGGFVTFKIDEDLEETVCLEVGDILIMDGLTSHKMDRVVSGQVEYLACFYCGNLK